MGVQGFQDYIEKHCPKAVVPVELQKLARGSLVGGGRQRPPQTPLLLLVDAENCLHRLYGGFYTDWVSGGQWNHMLGYLAALSKACFNGNIDLFVFFNGALEKGRLHEWVKRQANERQTAQQILSHIQNKGTPPPKVWFLPPVCMAHCIRLALIRFRIKVAQSTEDHHQEVIAFCRENGFHGLVAYDSDYALCNIPYYFSAHALKLSRNGKSLTTNQYLMHEVAKQLDLNPNRFSIFAALLGNHILPDEDLAAFHWSLLGPEHPLVSLKYMGKSENPYRRTQLGYPQLSTSSDFEVRAHQLVLPPCDVVIKAVADYVRNIQNISDLDSIAKDVFKQSKSRTDDKVIRFKRAVEYYSAASKSLPYSPAHYMVRQNHLGLPSPIPIFVPHPVLHIPQSSVPSKAATQQPASGVDGGQSPSDSSPTQEASNGKNLPEQSNHNNIPQEGKHTPLYERSSPVQQSQQDSPNHTEPAVQSSTSSSSENDESSGATNHISGNKLAWEKSGTPLENQTGGEAGDQTKADASNTSPGSHGVEESVSQVKNAHIPSLLSMPTRNHMDITTPPLPPVAPEVSRVAEHRHKKGLMYPYIYHILTKGEIKIPVTIEDEANKDLPPAALLYRQVRQYVYGVLFNLAESRKKAERLALRRNRMSPEFPLVLIKEWAVYKGKSLQTPELVEALAFREWTCPSLKKLWLGKAVEDKNRRMRAFLACMRSDTPAMLNPSLVPSHLLVLCCVLRYMVQWQGIRILRRQELDAFIAQAVSPKLFEPDQLQELKIENLDPRGIQLSALFMSGVDMALFANDACGQPIPWEHCCPWMYFDGKLFQSKYIKANREKVSLLDLCDGQAEQAAKVEKIRQSILEGLNFTRPIHPIPFLPPPPPPPMPFYPAAVYPRPVCPMPPPPGRGRNFAGVQPIPPQGGKLEIAGTVVGQWAGTRRGRGRGFIPLQVVSVGGPNRGRPRGVISTPVIRTFGRGGRYYHRGSKTQGAGQQSKPPYAASAAEVAKELKKSKPEDSKSSAVSSDSSVAENGAANENKPASQLNGSNEVVETSITSESALSNDSKMCNTNPHLNALNADSSCQRVDALEAAVLNKEE